MKTIIHGKHIDDGMVYFFEKIPWELGKANASGNNVTRKCEKSLLFTSFTII